MRSRMSPLYGCAPGKVIEMLHVLGASAILPGFEQCIGAFISEENPINRATFNRLCEKVGCRSIGIIEWKRINVRTTAMSMDAQPIYDMCNDYANTAYDDVCSSLWDDNIPFTLSVAEKRLTDWIQNPTLHGAKRELIDCYSLILKTWQTTFGVPSPLEAVLAEDF